MVSQNMNAQTKWWVAQRVVEKLREICGMRTVLKERIENTEFLLYIEESCKVFS